MGRGEASETGTDVECKLLFEVQQLGTSHLDVRLGQRKRTKRSSFSRLSHAQGTANEAARSSTAYRGNQTAHSYYYHRSHGCLLALRFEILEKPPNTAAAAS